MGENFDSLLSALVDEDKIVYEELLALLADAPCAEEDEELSLLQQMVKDSRRYREWFHCVQKQTDR